MATFTNQTKNSSTHTNQSKNTSTNKNYLRHGKEPTMADLANYVFTDVVFMDGTQLKDVTFSQLTDIVWTNLTKN